MDLSSEGLCRVVGSIELKQAILRGPGAIRDVVFCYYQFVIARANV